jgi:hypothetical protein
VAHGLALRKAARDKSTSVDLVEKVTLTSLSEPEIYALFVSQAACFPSAGLYKA